MIPPNSRYNSPQGTLVRLPNAAGVYNLSVLRQTPSTLANYTLYTWKPGDRADLVAAKQLGNANLWWAIFDINPQIIYPLSIPPGTIIRIPTNPIMSQGTLLQ